MKKNKLYGNIYILLHTDGIKCAAREYKYITRDKIRGGRSQKQTEYRVGFSLRGYIREKTAIYINPAGSCGMSKGGSGDIFDEFAGDIAARRYSEAV